MISLLFNLIVAPIALVLLICIYWLVLFVIFEVICGCKFTDWTAKQIIKVQDFVEKKFS